MPAFVPNPDIVRRPLKLYKSDQVAHQPIPHLRSYLKRSHSLRQGKGQDDCGKPGRYNLSTWPCADRCRWRQITSSLSARRLTIIKPSCASGLCTAFASSQGARIYTSRSSSVVRITGMAFGWIGSTIAFGWANRLKLAKMMVSQKISTTRNGIGIELPICANNSKRVCAISVLT